MPCGANQLNIQLLLYDFSEDSLSAKDCTKKVGEITIGADGTGSIKLPNKQYYVKEISAPKGYDLSSDVVALKANSNVNVEEDVTSGKIR